MKIDLFESFFKHNILSLNKTVATQEIYPIRIYRENLLVITLLVLINKSIFVEIQIHKKNYKILGNIYFLFYIAKVNHITYCFFSIKICK